VVRALDWGAPHRRRRIAAATKLGGGGGNGDGERELGFAGERGSASTRIRRGSEGRVKGRHGSRGWLARGTEAGVNRRRRRVPRRAGENREEGEGEADRWGPAWDFFFLFFSGL
jgi:hypothetical protein